MIKHAIWQYVHICRHSRSDGKKPASSSTPLRQVGLTLWMEMHCVVQAKRGKRSRRNGGTVGVAHGKLGCVPFHMCTLVLKGTWDESRDARWSSFKMEPVLVCYVSLHRKHGGIQGSCEERLHRVHLHRWHLPLWCRSLAWMQARPFLTDKMGRLPGRQYGMAETGRFYNILQSESTVGGRIQDKSAKQSQRKKHRWKFVVTQKYHKCSRVCIQVSTSSAWAKAIIHFRCRFRVETNSKCVQKTHWCV